ncbi:hypothetical protein T492DRAFT_1143077, partial [Pavlovales sp. CCMP2436]
MARLRGALLFLLVASSGGIVDAAAAVSCPGYRNCPPASAPGRLCPAGTGELASDANFRWLFNVSDEADLRTMLGVHEDHKWGDTAPITQCGVRGVRREWGKVSCAVVPSQKLYFAQIYKSGTRSLLKHLSCLHPGKGELRLHAARKENRLQNCRRYAADFKHIAVVREPLERYVSAFLQIITGAWYEKSQRDSKRDFDQEFLAFTALARCHHDGDLIHSGSMAWLVRQRPVTQVIHLPDLGATMARDFDAHERAAQCHLDGVANPMTARINLTESIHSLHKSEVVERSTPYYFELLQRTKPDLLRKVCAWYAQDYECLFKQFEPAMGEPSLFVRHCLPARVPRPEPGTQVRP